jgi:hypothetical protein
MKDLLDTLDRYRFNGFPAYFYSAIPFAEGRLVIDDSFAEAAALLTDYDDIAEVYERLGLPDKKRFKEIIFNKPDLLFYADELRRFPFGNYDVKIRILHSYNLYPFLHILHSTPKVRDFINALISVKDESAAWDSIDRGIGTLVQAAAKWNMLSAAQQNTPHLLRGNLHDIDARLFGIPYSSGNFPLPRRHSLSRVEKQVGAYRFVLLKNRFMYKQAASALNNCLALCVPSIYSGTNDVSTVIVMVKQGKAVAAIDLVDDQITQAKLYDNEPIKADADIYDSFLKWLDLCDLGYDSESDVEGV